MFGLKVRAPVGGIFDSLPIPALPFGEVAVGLDSAAGVMDLLVPIESSLGIEDVGDRLPGGRVRRIVGHIRSAAAVLERAEVV